MKGLSIQTKTYLIAGIYLLINALQSFFMPLINDEAYYWVWSRNLDWGYYDHPPMVALWVKLGFTLFQNELGARFITILFSAIGFILLAKLLVINTTKHLTLYAYLFFAMVLFQVFGFITTPDAPLLFFGILYLYILKIFLDKPNINNALLLGLSMALLLYSKYHGVLLIVFTLLPHAVRLLKYKYIYIAVLFGVLCFLPHILWQIHHDFAPLEYHLVRRNVNTSFKLNNLGDYMLSLVWASSPLLVYHHVKAVIKTRYNSPFQKSLIYAVLGIIGFFIIITFKRYIQAQWSLIAFIPLFIIVYNYYKNKSGAIKTIKILSIATIILIFVARIYFIVQEVPINTQYHGWKQFSKKAGEVTQGKAVFEKYQYTSLFNFYNYPNQTAHNYVTLENRLSQYNLMESEPNLEGEEITYFSKYLVTNDSVILEEGNPDAVFYYKHIPKYHTTSHIEMKFTDEDIIKRKDSLQIKVKLINHGDFAVHLSPENHFSLKKIIAEKPYSNHILNVEDVKYSPVNVLPMDSVTIPIVVSKNKFNSFDNAISYLGWSYDGLPVKKQSNYIEESIE